jgi:hypothetical protein
MIDKMVNCTAADRTDLTGCSLWGLYGWHRVNSYKRGHRFERGEFQIIKNLTYRCPICCLKIMIMLLNHICIPIDGRKRAQL